MDYYSLLGVSKNASQEEIKKSYRKLAAQHHPDRGGDTKKFQEIQAAYDVLGDPEKRAEYDNPQPQMGGFHFQQGGMPPGFEDIFRAFGGNPFEGMFQQRQRRNHHLNIQTQITLEEAYNGKNLIATIRLPSGKEQLIEVKIPPGIHSGTTLRLNGLGDDTHPNLPRGDIHLTVTVQPHTEFHRNGDDLIRIFEINCIEAMLGTKKSITTIDNKLLEVTIQPGTQPEQILSIHGYGMPNINDNRFKGRLLIHIKIKIPTELSDSQKTLLKQLFN